MALSGAGLTPQRSLVFSQLLEAEEWELEAVASLFPLETFRPNNRISYSVFVPGQGRVAEFFFLAISSSLQIPSATAPKSPLQHVETTVRYRAHTHRLTLPTTPRPVNAALRDTGDFAGVIILDYLGMG